MKEYISAWKNAFCYKGKSGRRAFNMVYLVMHPIVCILLIVIDVFVIMRFVPDMIIPPLAIIGSFAGILPIAALSVRRLHDIGKSGWYYALMLVPGLNLILLLFLMFAKSKADTENMPSDAAVLSA